MASQRDKKIAQVGLPSTGVLDFLGLPDLVLKAASSIAILVGCSVLLGWTLDVDVLKRILPGLVAMNPTTAIAFVLAGVSLWLLRTANAASRPRRIAKGLAFAVALIGLLKLAGLLFGWDVGIDQLVFAEKLEQEADVTGFANRMAPNTALNFFLLGCALLLVDRRTPRGYWLAQSLIFVSVAASLLAIFGYAFGVTSFYGVTSYIPMALHTALTFVVLSVGLLCVRPDRGLMALVTSDSMGGVVVRRLLPAAILVQVALAWLRLIGQQAGLYGTELGVALMVVSSMVILTALFGWSASLLHRSDNERKRAEKKQREAYEELDVRVQERTAELAKANATLRESEERFRLLVEGVQGYAIFMLDPEGRVASWNEGAERIKGYETEEIIGEHFSIFYTEEDVERGHPEEELRLAVSEGRYEEEGLRVRKDGSRFWASVLITALRDEKGRLRGFSKITRDISERKRNEEELKESEARKTAIMEAALDCIITMDHEGMITDFNPAAERTFGYRRAKVLGRELAETIIPPPLRDAHRRGLAHYLTTGEGPVLGRRIELQGMRADGTEFPVELTIVPVRIGEQPMFTGYLRDITERKEAEETLRTSEERFRSLVQHASDIITILEADGTVRYISPSVERVLGYRPEEQVGTATFGAVHPDDEERALSVFAGILDKPGLQPPIEFRVPHKGGSWRYLEHTINNLLDDPGVGGIVVNSRDTTERRRYEEALRERAEELARSNAELEQFAYVASHDLQEPLRMVSSYTQLLARRYKGRLDDDADEFIGYAVDGANRMQNLIQDLLQYSRVGTRGNELAPTDTRNVFEAACTNLRKTIGESGAEVASGELPIVLGDQGQLVQLFQNLISNAIKFRKEEEPPKVYVGAERRDGEWLFSVSDNGIGIDPQYAERIFVLFQRLHGKVEYPGTGIGLAVCKKIVERHGGKIWVESEPGEGSTFYLTLRDGDKGR